MEQPNTAAAATLAWFSVLSLINEPELRKSAVPAECTRGSSTLLLWPNFRPVHEF
jgi:hypothetical protein